MQRVTIDMASFDSAGALLRTLREHGVTAGDTGAFDPSQKRAGTDFLVVSEARALALGGQTGVIEAARGVGARSVLVVDEAARMFAVTETLGGKIAQVAPGQGMAPDYQVMFIAALLHGTRRALVRDEAVRAAFGMAAKVAQADVSVFINGPTGSGKEVMARYIHDNSRRSTAAFVAINCAAIPENMLEAMLFGHEKGAFTGASTSNVGLIRAAEGGTLLLDEISEMSLPLQAKLLRAIQELAVTPVGGTRQINVDIRILATSNRDMRSECAAGRFREDLFYRLNVFPVATMPLAARRVDILPIAQQLLVRHAREITKVAYLAPCAIARLEGHDWPGNIRELENVIQRALVLSDGACITEAAIMLDPVMDTSSFGQAGATQPVTASLAG